MYQLTVTYAHPEDPQAFLDHYKGTHAPTARAMPGLKSFEWSVYETPDGSKPAKFLVAMLRWDSKEDLLAGLGSPEGADAVADLANFAGAGVDIAIGEVVTEI